MAAEKKKIEKKFHSPFVCHFWTKKRDEDKSEEQKRRAQIVGDSLHIGYIGSIYVYKYTICMGK